MTAAGTDDYDDDDDDDDDEYDPASGRPDMTSSLRYWPTPPTQRQNQRQSNEKAFGAFSETDVHLLLFIQIINFVDIDHCFRHEYLQKTCSQHDLTFATDYKPICCWI